MTTPQPPALAVHPDDLARRVGLDLPLDGEQEWTLREAIADVQAEVEAYLNRPIMPRVVVESGLWPGYNDRFTLREPDVVGIDRVTADLRDGFPTGTYTVTYRVGLDARNDPNLAAIKRYVLRRAMVHDSVAALVPVSKRQVNSVSVEGQSVSFAPAGGVEVPAEQRIPQISSLERWKRRGVFQRRG